MSIKDSKTEKPCNIDIVKGSCSEKCCLGDEGHCGRTEYEYLHHCEKLNNEGKNQRAKMKLKSSDFNCP